MNGPAWQAPTTRRRRTAPGPGPVAAAGRRRPGSQAGHVGEQAVHCLGRHRCAVRSQGEAGGWAGMQSPAGDGCRGTGQSHVHAPALRRSGRRDWRAGPWRRTRPAQPIGRSRPTQPALTRRRRRDRPGPPQPAGPPTGNPCQQAGAAQAGCQAPVSSRPPEPPRWPRQRRCRPGPATLEPAPAAAPLRPPDPVRPVAGSARRAADRRRCAGPAPARLGASRRRRRGGTRRRTAR